MKPTLLLFGGICFCATTPLYYTLCWDNKYAHGGHCKETEYFRVIENNKLVKRFLGQREKDLRNKPPILCSNSPYVKFSGEEFFCKDISIERYIDYFLTHWNHIKKDGYHAVCDLSNANMNVSSQLLERIRDQIQKHFVIKWLMIVRDPIRRLFSVSNRLTQNYTANEWFRGLDALQHFKISCKNPSLSDIYCDYVGRFQKIEKIFGKGQMIVMEEFFDKNSKRHSKSVDDLSKYLNYKIEKIHENVYTPDMGSKAPHLKYLRDQWSSDVIDMDEDTYQYAMSHMKHIYDDYKNKFGYIPEEWGQ